MLKAKGTTMQTQVCAATVAFNDPEELARLLASLADQGPALKGLVIVDNSGPAYAVENRKLFDVHSTRFQFAQYHAMTTNVGSAGGFRRAMEIAHANSFDWVWMLDQDGTVSPHCLTELLKHANEADILCPRVVDIDKPTVALTYMRLRKDFFGTLHPASLRAGDGSIDAFGTHGVLISRTVVDAIGYYDSCHFFIGLEDYDYSNRALRARFIVSLTTTAEVKHPDLLRKRAMHEKKKPVEVHKRRPVHLGVIPHGDRASFARHKGRSLALFSQFYYFSKSLTRWQFTIAFIYSLSDNLLGKLIKRDELCLRKTLKAYAKCFFSNISGQWHLGCVEEFCQLILE